MPSQTPLRPCPAREIHQAGALCGLCFDTGTTTVDRLRRSVACSRCGHPTQGFRWQRDAGWATRCEPCLHRTGEVPNRHEVARWELRAEEVLRELDGRAA